MLDYRLVVLKGIVEKKDRGAYFASFGALDYYTDGAIEQGWVYCKERGYYVTDAGIAEYNRRHLEQLPRVGRAYLWPHVLEFMAEEES
jgi:hypothetical protein